MPSKSIISYKNLKDLESKVTPGITCIEFPDCFIERFFIDSVGDRFKKIFAQDVTRDFIENDLLSVGLFGSDGPFLVLLGEALHARSIELLMESSLPDDATIVFVTHQKFSDKKFLKKVNHLFVEGPKFWEMNEYFNFMASNLNLSLSLDIKNFLLANLSPTPQDFFVILTTLSTYKKEELTLALVRSLTSITHIDNFKLADLFNEKNIKRVYQNLLIVENDFELYRNFFTFMQGHIVKAMDSRAILEKPKLSKYDKGLILASKKWSTTELEQLLLKFGNFEIMCKQKNIWFRNELRQEFLKA